MPGGIFVHRNEDRDHGTFQALDENQENRFLDLSGIDSAFLAGFVADQVFDFE